MAIFTEAMKAGVRKHKYSCIDTNPLSNYVMHPFWNYAVKFCPDWITPNALTVLGFSLTVLNFFILSYFDMDFISASSVPRPVWLLSAFLLFAAHTLDGIDGKQARRLGLSSPLGEMMDHCCDAWTAVFYPLIFCTLFSGHLENSLIHTGEWIILFGFLLAHWEKSITGVLCLPWSYDIGQVATVLLFIVTALASPSIWLYQLPIVQMNVPEVLPYLAHFVFWILTVPTSLLNVGLACAQDRSLVPTPEAVVRPLAGTVFVCLVSYLWAARSPTRLLVYAPRLFIVCSGTLAANVICRVILADVTKTKAPMWSHAMGVYGLVAFVLALGLPPAAAAQIEYPCLVALTTYLVLDHIRFSRAVVNEMCEIFNIRAFTMEPRSVKAQ